MENNLVLEILNNGGKISEDWFLDFNKGIGLKNVENCLGNLFDEYEFGFWNSEDEELVIVCIFIFKL